MEHLSFSQYNLYCQCPFKYYLEYVLGLRDDTYKGYFAIGSSFHKGLEVLGSSFDYDRAKDTFKNDLLNEPLNEFEKAQVDNLTWNLSVYSEMYFPKYKDRIVGREISFLINIPKVPIPMKGIIDVVYSNGLSDYKTAQWEGKKSKTSYNRYQLAIYSLWFFQTYKVLPQDCEVHVFNKAFRYALDGKTTAIDIIKEKITMDDINIAIVSIQQFWQDIQNKRFIPNLNAWKKTDKYYNLMVKYVNEKINS
jgi:hypothetical protein